MMERRKIRKIIQVGTGAAVSLPPEFLFAAGLKRGDWIILIYDQRTARIEPLSESTRSESKGETDDPARRE